MDRTGNGGTGFEAFMILMIGLSAIAASISIYFTGL